MKKMIRNMMVGLGLLTLAGSAIAHADAQVEQQAYTALQNLQKDLGDIQIAVADEAALTAQKAEVAKAVDAFLSAAPEQDESVRDVKRWSVSYQSSNDDNQNLTLADFQLLVHGGLELKDMTSLKEQGERDQRDQHNPFRRLFKRNGSERGK